VNVFIGRDGVELGEYPRAELDARARRGELEEGDYYWHEGMDAWRPLNELLGPEAWTPEEPALPPPKEWPRISSQQLIVLGAVAFGVLLLMAIVAYFLFRDPSAFEIAAMNSMQKAAPPLTVQTQNQIRDKAAADLKQRIERLPGRPTPPLNTFYYDVRVNMQRTLSSTVPWNAVMTGEENIVDPATQQTIQHTNFILTTEYRDGHWTFTHYQASTASVTSSSTTEMEADEDSPTPPSIVGMLGLKIKG
jgi:uncharacterized protein DUF4339